MALTGVGVCAALVRCMQEGCGSARWFGPEAIRAFGPLGRIDAGAGFTSVYFIGAFYPFAEIVPAMHDACPTMGEYGSASDALRQSFGIERSGTR